MRRLLLCVALLGMGVAVDADIPVVWATSTVKLFGQERTYSDATGRICYDYYDVGEAVYHIGCMDANGANDTCLTCAFTADRHYGMPRLSPDGQWLMFQQDNGGCPLEDSFPGLGSCNDLAIMPAVGGTVTIVRSIGTGQVLHPAWHPDGNQIMWAEQTGGPGTWLIRFAPITFPGSTPTLGTIVSIAPGAVDAFYEPYHWFGPGLNQIVFACIVDADDNALNDMDICTYNLRTTVLSKLMSTNDILDEHAHPTNDGTDRFVYSSSTGNSNFLLLDYWVMNFDGTDQRRLTFYNDPNDPSYVANGITAFGVNWIDGNTFIGALMLDRSYPFPSNIYRFDFGAVQQHRRGLPPGVRVHP